MEVQGPRLSERNEVHRFNFSRITVNAEIYYTEGILNLISSKTDPGDGGCQRLLGERGEGGSALAFEDVNQF